MTVPTRTFPTVDASATRPPDPASRHGQFSMSTPVTTTETNTL